MNPDELRLKYDKLSDSDLLRAYQSPADYTPDAFKILSEVVAERGGEAAIHDRIALSSALQSQLSQLRQRIQSQFRAGQFSPSEDIAEDLDQISAERFQIVLAEEKGAWEHEKKHQTVTNRSLILGILGALLGAAVGGPIFAAMQIGPGKFSGFFILGIGSICYGFVRGFSGKGIRNTATLMLTILSFALAMYFGAWIYLHFDLEQFRPKGNLH